MDIIGETPINKFREAPHNEWFSSSYNSYIVNTRITDEIKVKKLLKDVAVEVFYGSWCPDSHEQVPAFYKITEELELTGDKATYIGLDRNKKSPKGFESGKNITHVPTFIFYKNSEEIGRIIEKPKESLEEDLLNILL